MYFCPSCLLKKIFLFLMHFFVHYYPHDEENMIPRQFDNCCKMYIHLAKLGLRKQDPKCFLKSKPLVLCLKGQEFCLYHQIISSPWFCPSPLPWCFPLTCPFFRKLTDVCSQETESYLGPWAQNKTIKKIKPVLKFYNITIIRNYNNIAKIFVVHSYKAILF